jgi:hypothetical protein
LITLVEATVRAHVGDLLADPKRALRPTFAGPARVAGINIGCSQAARQILQCFWDGLS